MALQTINWTQIDTANVPAGATVDLGSNSTSLNAAGMCSRMEIMNVK